MGFTIIIVIRTGNINCNEHGRQRFFLNRIKRYPISQLYDLPICMYLCVCVYTYTHTHIHRHIVHGYSEKAMAPHSSTLAWKIPWAEEPGKLQSMGSLRVGHDWATSLSLFTFMHWRRKWQPTPVFLPGESQGQGSLVGYRLWGRTELDTKYILYNMLKGNRN